MSRDPGDYPYDVFAGARHIATMRPPFNAAGSQVVKLTCRCGWATDWWPLGHESCAEAELREHAAGAHCLI